MDDTDLLAAVPFATHCGIELVDAAPEEVRARMGWAAERCTAGGILHGGAIVTLADTAGAVGAFLNLPPGAATATTDTTTHLLRAVGEGWVEAVARPLSVGRRVIVVRTDLLDGDGRQVAATTQTQLVLARSG